MDPKEIGFNKRNWVDSAQGRGLRRALVNMDPKEIGFNKKNWVDSAQDRGLRRALVNLILYLGVP